MIVKIEIRRDNIIALMIGFIIATIPQFAMASSIDWDEFMKTLAGGGGVGIASIIYALKGRRVRHAEKA